jgi:hypothetical protein
VVAIVKKDVGHGILMSEKLYKCECGASFETDAELNEHHQSEHGEYQK